MNKEPMRVGSGWQATNPVERQLNLDTLENTIMKAHYQKILTLDEVKDHVEKIVDKLRAFKAGE